WSLTVGQRAGGEEDGGLGRCVCGAMLGDRCGLKRRGRLSGKEEKRRRKEGGARGMTSAIGDDGARMGERPAVGHEGSGTERGARESGVRG
ncbi:hypothetical protein BVRB_013820, partial [Beta vulgaris subsp. vulgaris]